MVGKHIFDKKENAKKEKIRLHRKLWDSRRLPFEFDIQTDDVTYLAVVLKMKISNSFYNFYQTFSKF